MELFQARDSGEGLPGRRRRPVSEQADPRLHDPGRDPYNGIVEAKERSIARAPKIKHEAVALGMEQIRDAIRLGDQGFAYQEGVSWKYTQSRWTSGDAYSFRKTLADVGEFRQAPWLVARSENSRCAIPAEKVSCVWARLVRITSWLILRETMCLWEGQQTTRMDPWGSLS